MNSSDIRKKFLKYFEDRDHAVVSSSSLIPDDPSVLLTTAGMQQFKQYFTGELDPIKDFKSKSTTSVQKSFRTSDIDEVGDESHLTFFEMLGNFSFGGYFKEEAIKYAYEFIIKEIGLEIDHVSVFDPKKVSKEDWRACVPFDEESYNIWKNIIGLKEEKIRKEGIDNFWGPTGTEGPCGPTTEIYVKGVEIWNIVFNEFYCSPCSGLGEAGDKNKKLSPLETPGVDTGMGLERLVMVSQNVPTIFDTDLFRSLMALLPAEIDERTKRIVVDHARGVVFLISDGVRPSNKEAGYMLRRLMRRIMRYEIDPVPLFKKIVKEYINFYPELNEKTVLVELEKEKNEFEKALKLGKKEVDKLKEPITGLDIFNIYQSAGTAFTIAVKMAEDRGLDVGDKKKLQEEFQEELRKHQEVSRAGVEKKFGGHGLVLDTGELKAGSEEELQKTIRLHTATHLLHQALREVLGSDVRQMGSDVNAKRARFDFSFERKLTDEEIKRTEEIVNEKIKQDWPVRFVEMSKDEAEKTGALHFFKEKYPEMVKIYYVGDALETAWSREFCGGPHVKSTGEIGKFRVQKQESIGAGARRVRGVVEP